MRLLHLVRHAQAEGEGEAGLTDVGREQARLLGVRLRDARIDAIEHGPLPRAAATAAILRDQLDGVPVRENGLLDDVIPPVPDPAAVAAPYADFLSGVTPERFAAGAAVSMAAVEHYARSDTDRLVLVTHGFAVAWFVARALDAPLHRWLGLSPGNASVTTIRYRDDRPPVLVTYNDMSHLPPPLRWTGFPAELRD